MSFTPLASDFYGFESQLTDPEREALAALRVWLETDVKPLVNDHWDRAEFPHEILPAFHRHPVFGMQWDETKSFENSAVYRGWVALELARVDASIATYVGVQNGLALGAVAVCGSPEQRAEWLPKLASGEVIGAFGLTEPLSGSDSAQGLRTTATREGDEWILNGAKRWIGNATFSDITVIWAKDTADGQVKGFIVPTSTPGYTATKIERKQALRIVQNADIVLEDVACPRRCACRMRTRSATRRPCCVSRAPRSHGRPSESRSAPMRVRSRTRRSASSSASPSHPTSSCSSTSPR